MSIETLSDVPLYAARPSRQVAPKRRLAAWIAVGVVHFLIFNLLIFSPTWQSLQTHGTEHETILDLRGASRDKAPDVKMVVPEGPIGTPPDIVPVPIIPPPPPPPEPAQPPTAREGGGPKGDLLGALGRELACTAGNYENLNEAQRARCPRIPWQGAMLPDGALVLNRPAPPNRFAPPPPEFRISGADANRLKIERADPCPVMLNVPCLNRIPGRDD